MSPDDIRGMLLEALGALKYDLLKRDREQAVTGKPAPEVVNAAVAAIVARGPH